KSLARSALRRTPVRLRVRAMEKKAMAAVIARRGCSMVWPTDRKAWATRVRKGRTLVEKAGWAIAAGTRAGRPGRVAGVRRRSVLPGTMGGLFAAAAAWAAWPVVWAMMRSGRAVGGSGRGDLSSCIQA